MALDLSPFSDAYTTFWASSLFASFAVLTVLFSAVGPFKGRAALAAHHVVMVAPFAFLSYQGLVHWNSSSNEVADDPGSRLFFKMPGAACFAPTMLGLQIFDLTTTVLVPGMGKPDAIAHHTVALLLAYWLTSTRFLDYWKPFYFGILEISSVPLCFVDLFRAFPKLAKRVDAVNEAVRIAFAATFLPVRCLIMPYVSYFWWKDFLALYAAADPKLMAHFGLFISFGAMNVFLCVLQQYWGYKIINAAMKMAKGDKVGREKEV
ncbi:hypothetical protein KFE25_000744 [Diacronema lutheri]|uniref:TLC domain-containing protein n=1 Tax=Diacronema lutheri TaxID=2081491 RepID=A0A7R9UNW6_DIALT|nr:hypothetical protein KFE25_000744 [Diacronema lutheri]|mmetsp:Transcript_17859/g.55583  ORF Transcript_17859/g.55583 Transcript_17859/m.55583 type:complete len:263 (+) Transcript_17859:19-807(+)